LLESSEFTGNPLLKVGDEAPRGGLVFSFMAFIDQIAPWQPCQSREPADVAPNREVAHDTTIKLQLHMYGHVPAQIAGLVEIPACEGIPGTAERGEKLIGMRHDGRVIPSMAPSCPEREILADHHADVAPDVEHHLVIERRPCTREERSDPGHPPGNVALCGQVQARDRLIKIGPAPQVASIPEMRSLRRVLGNVTEMLGVIPQRKVLEIHILETALIIGDGIAVTSWRSEVQVVESTRRDQLERAIADDLAQPSQPFPAIVLRHDPAPYVADDVRRQSLLTKCQFNEIVQSGPKFQTVEHVRDQ